MTDYVRGANPIWFEVDLTSNHFDDTFYLFVLQNDLPYLPATTYHGPNGEIPTTDPIQFLANGTLPIDTFFLNDPDVLYRLEFRHGPTQADPLIYLVENYSPATGGGNVVTFEVTTDNQITNPQFSLINFVSPLTITSGSAQEIEVAPGWTLVLTGTGNLTVTQEALIGSGATINPSNAPYSLRIQTSGWDTAILRQRFQQNGMLWATKVVSSAITARVGASSLTNTISATIAPSTSTDSPTTVLASTTLTVDYVQYTGDGTLPATTNTDVPPDAYVDFLLHLNGNMDVYVSSIQLVVGEVAGFRPGFEQDSIERQIDHSFNYYKPLLEFKPIPSLLAGWDFPVNPGQPRGPTGAATISVNAAYMWDQTISECVVNTMAVLRNTVTGGFQATTADADQAFYVMQYLSGNEAREILGTELSVNINAFRTQAGGDVAVKVYLFRGNAASVFPTLPLTIGGATPLAANGNFTLNAVLNEGLGWTEIGRSNLGPATGTLSTVSTADYSTLNDVEDLKFNGWEIISHAEIADTSKFAIVVTFSCPTSGTVVVLDSISMVKGGIPTRPGAETASQSLERCQYYYQQSFAPGIAPAVGTGVLAGLTNASMGIQVSVLALDAGPVIRFQTTMRTVPSIVMYSPFFATDQIFSSNSNTGWTNTAVYTQTLGVRGFATVGNAVIGDNGSPCSIHWTADARLGIV